MMRKNLARYALLVALAMALSWLESMIPLPGLLPGMKVGLANLVVVFALYRMSPRDAASISLVRVLLASAAFGSAYSFAYSLVGAALSLAVMPLTDLRVVKETKWAWKVAYSGVGGREKKLSIPKAYPGCCW